MGAPGRNPAGPPAWAYPLAASDYQAPVDDGSVRHVLNSAARWTLTQLRNLFFVPDWRPEDHPRMPEVVARGRKPDVYACGFCHRLDGAGGLENASLAGLPEAYIVQQMADFQSGARKSAVPNRTPPILLAKIVKAATDAEVAAYFSSLQPGKIIAVVETLEVPKTYVAGFLFAPLNDRDKEPICNPIVEVAKDLEGSPGAHQAIWRVSSMIFSVGQARAVG
jgi:cytochrome c553